MSLLAMRGWTAGLLGGPASAGETTMKTISEIEAIKQAYIARMASYDRAMLLRCLRWQRISAHRIKTNAGLAEVLWNWNQRKILGETP